MSNEKETIKVELEILGNEEENTSQLSNNCKRPWSVFFISLTMMTGLLISSSGLRYAVEDISTKTVKTYYFSEKNPAKNIFEKYSGMPFRDVSAKLSADENLALNAADKDASLIKNTFRYLFYALQLVLTIIFSTLMAKFSTKRKSK